MLPLHVVSAPAVPSARDSLLPVASFFARRPPNIPLLTVLISGSAIAYNVYLPSMPDLGRDFGVSIRTVQTTLIAFLVAYAIAQFFYGGVADRFGRRPVLLWALAIYVIASLACTVAPDIDTLVAARVVQGIGAAGPIVLVRAMVRDLYDRKQSARALSIISTVMVFAPATAPAIGGWLHAGYGWTASFVFLSVLAAALWLWCFLRMAETGERETGTLVGNFLAMARGYRVLMGRRVFVAYSLNIGFLAGGVFAWFAGVPGVLIDSYGLAPDHAGYLMVTGTMGAFIGYASSIWLTGLIGVNRMIVLGSTVAFIGASVYVALPLAGIYSPLAAIMPMSIFGLGLALNFPNVMAASVSLVPQYSGTAAAINGLVQYGTAAVTTLIVRELPHDTHLALGILIFATQCCSMGSALVGWRNRPAE